MIRFKGQKTNLTIYALVNKSADDLEVNLDLASNYRGLNRYLYSPSSGLAVKTVKAGELSFLGLAWAPADSTNPVCDSYELSVSPS